MRDWFAHNIVKLQAYFDDKKPQCATSRRWWTFLFAVHAFAREASVVAKALQGQMTLVEEQRGAFTALVSKHCRMTSMAGPLDINELAAINLSINEVCGQFALNHSHVHEFINELPLRALSSSFELRPADVQLLVVAVAKLFVHRASGVHQVVTERSSTNTREEELAPVLPLQITRMSIHEFKKTQRSTAIHKVTQDFAALRRALLDEDSLRIALERSAALTFSFNESWALTHGRYSYLQGFCGDLASVFPNTATVESDFSILGWERDVHHLGITNFSLEGVLQCKQFDQLKQLSRVLDA